MAVREPEATRAAILDAAIAEFSRHGYAGARTERIAEAAGKNRAMIYKYFINKETLYRAVFDRIVVATTDDVPMDAADLPGYAVRLFDHHLREPEALRLAAWDRLEGDGQGLGSPLVAATNVAKVRAIKAEQFAGRVSDRIPASQLLDVVVALSRLQGRRPEGDLSRRDIARLRSAIREAVAAVVRP